MERLSRWLVHETPANPDTAADLWRDCRARGAVGAVTSWGSGMGERSFLRVFWDAGRTGGMTGEERRDAEDLVEEDWRPHWRESLSPFAVSDAVTIAPAWDEAAAAPGRVIRIDPGMAFGAGDHPTTRRMVAMLETLGKRGQLPDRALDLGCGTGVLALVAAHLGVSRVTAVDIDPFCYWSTVQNARRNGLDHAVEAVLASLDLVEGRFPLIVANLVVHQIRALAPAIRARLTPGALLLLSGFTEGAFDEKLSTYFERMTVMDRMREQGWEAVALKGPVNV